MKNYAVAVVLVAAGCAVPQNPAADPFGGAGSDLGGFGTGGNGGDAGADAGTGAGDLASAPVDDMARAAPDLALGPDMTPPPDMTPACTPPAGSACVVYPQCGCAANQSCDIPGTASNSTAVCVAVGSTPDWNGCTAAGQCRKGSTCFLGVCVPFCGHLGAPSADCGGGTTECAQVQDDATPPADIPNKKICTRNCDPTNPQNATGFQPCGPGTNCLPSSDHYAYCIGGTASGTQGRDCTDDGTKCAPGYACALDSLGFGTCYKMCHRAKSGECPSSTSCHSFATKQYAGADEIGYCD